LNFSGRPELLKCLYFAGKETEGGTYQETGKG
jgi:hypothetical protein